MYLDGQFAVGTGPFGDYIGTDTLSLAGMGPALATNYLAARFDELLMWPRVLQPDEVWRGATKARWDVPALWFKFAAQSGSTVYDSSVRGANWVNAITVSSQSSTSHLAWDPPLCLSKPVVQPTTLASPCSSTDNGHILTDGSAGTGFFALKSLQLAYQSWSFCLWHLLDNPIDPSGYWSVVSFGNSAGTREGIALAWFNGGLGLIVRNMPSDPWLAAPIQQKQWVHSCFTLRSPSQSGGGGTNLRSAFLYRDGNTDTPIMDNTTPGPIVGDFAGASVVRFGQFKKVARDCLLNRKKTYCALADSSTLSRVVFLLSVQVRIATEITVPV
jgi:hypothetical protein